MLTIIKKLLKHTVHCRLMCMWLHNNRWVRVPMLTPVYSEKHLQWACKHQSWTMK